MPHAAPGETISNIDDQPRNSFIGGTAAKIERHLIEMNALLAPDLGDIIHQVGIFEQNCFDVAASIFAIFDLGNRLDGVADIGST